MKYVALLRGIGPGNPNMTKEKFTEFFQGLGFTNVSVVISSGNIVFESDEKDSAKIENLIEEQLPIKLGYSRAAIVRSHDELVQFIASDPYKGIKDEAPNYLLVTFFKDRRPPLSSVLDMTDANTTKFMAKLDKEYKKAVTSRTWKTIQRIMKVMEK